ncbi:MAG: hypothetical protein WCR01_09115 [Bacteroidota bacterium]
MIIQYLIVGLLVGAALTLTIARLIRFFKAPASGCDGCSGCSLEVLKTEIQKKHVTRHASRVT